MGDYMLCKLVGSVRVCVGMQGAAMTLMGVNLQAQPAPAEMLSVVAALKSDVTTLRDRYAQLCVNHLAGLCCSQPA